MREKLFLIIILFNFFTCALEEKNSLANLLVNKTFFCKVGMEESRDAVIGFSNEHKSIVEVYNYMLSSNFNLTFTSNHYELTDERFSFKGEWFVENDRIISLGDGDSATKIDLLYVGQTNDELFLKAKEAFVIKDTITDRIEIYKAKGINLAFKEIK